MRRQQGLTLISTIIVLAVVGFFVVIGFKLVPVYTEYFSVKKALVQVATAPGARNATVTDLRKSFERFADAGYIDAVKKEDLDITKAGGVPVISVNYAVKVPVVANISLYIEFAASSQASGKDAE